MAWCPVCKNEYRPGIKVCADCGAELVEELDENPMETLIFGEKELLEQIQEFLRSNGYKYAQMEYAPERELHRLDIPRNDVKKAIELVQLFMREHTSRQVEQRIKEEIEAGNLTQEQVEEFQREAAKKQPAPRRQTVYESSEKKAEENKTSAWSLLLVGAVGLVLILLCVTGVIQIPGIFAGSWMFFGVMGALCILFLAMGVVSFRNAKKFEKNVDSEKQLKESLETWCRENLNAKEIDRFIRSRDPMLEDEAMFFPRNEIIKARINQQFENLDQSFLEQFVDQEVYEMLYPGESFAGGPEEV